MNLTYHDSNIKIHNNNPFEAAISHMANQLRINIDKEIIQLILDEGDKR